MLPMPVANTGWLRMKKAQSAPKRGGVVFHLLQTQCQTEFLVQQLNHERAIGRTASQSGTRGDVLEQVDVNGRYVMIFFQQFVGSDH